MPTGPFGGPRPFSSGTLLYTAHFSVESGIGERLESSSVKQSAEQLIAQMVEDVGFREPGIEIHPAGWSITVKVFLQDEIHPQGARVRGIQDLHNAVFDGVKQSVDTNVSRHSEEPDWLIGVS